MDFFLCFSSALIGEGFLELTSSQLTHHGLCELNRVVKEGDLCVFFRNNHFNTILKRKVPNLVLTSLKCYTHLPLSIQGLLLLLVTDSGFVNELDHVWQTVTDIDGSGDFLDAQFKYATHSVPQTNREQPPPPVEVPQEDLQLAQPAVVTSE